MKSRILIVFIGLMGLWIALFLRGAFLQIIPNERLSQLQRRQFETTIEVNGRRGLIVDRNGRELAASVQSQSLFADPQILEQPMATSRRLAKLLRVPYRDIYAKVKNRKRRFTWLKRHLTSEEVATIRRWDIRGLGIVEEAKRVYPNRNLLAQTLGFVGAEGQGLEGLELAHDSQLKGEMRRVILPRDARGRPLLGESGVLTNVKDGARLELTIDSELQFILETELAQVVGQYQAEGAIGLVLNPDTGEILAMASSPSFDPGELSGGGGSSRRNRPVTDAFEPGSTLKALVIAAAMRDGKIKPSTKFDCENGRMKIGNRWIKEADAQHSFQTLTVAEILAYSSNIGTAKIALQMGDEKLREALLDFGFGQKLGIDTPGESRGILRPLPWRPHHLANISFGHGVAVTPLQLTSAYAAIANGGRLMRPFVVRKKEQNGEVEEIQPQMLRRVLSEEQASTMRLMLRAATMEHATGVKARIPGFPVAGKTGTAQVVDFEKGGYRQGAYISSFAGFVPAHAPKFVIYVAIDNPKKEYYASQVAAPVFARIAQFAVRRAGLAPVLLTEENLLKDRPEGGTQATAVDWSRGLTPNLQGLSLREVYQRLRGANVALEIRGQGVVATSYPAAGAELPPDRKIRVFLEPVE